MLHMDGKRVNINETENKIPILDGLEQSDEVKPSNAESKSTIEVEENIDEYVLRREMLKKEQVEIEKAKLESQKAEIESQKAKLESQKVEVERKLELLHKEEKLETDKNHSDRQQDDIANGDSTSYNLGEEFEKLATEACKQEEDAWEKDNTEVQAYWQNYQLWEDKLRVLHQATERTINTCQDIPRLINENIREIEPRIDELLKGRRDGLALITEKMLPRVADRMQKSIIEKQQPPYLVKNGKDFWISILTKEGNLQIARQKVSLQLKTIDDERYKAVMEWRELANKQRKILLNLIEKQVLPIIDGIVDGKNHTEELEKEKTEKKNEFEKNIAFLLYVYNKLDRMLLENLEQVGVSRMNIEIGVPIDYERHEPFDVEKNSSLPNETVASIIRDGYEYCESDVAITSVLRPAQIIVAAQ